MLSAPDLLRLLAFLLVVATIYVTAVAVLYRRFVSKPRVPLQGKAIGILCAGGLGVLCMVYGAFIEPQWLEVTRTRVETHRLPRGHRGVRIVHLSDIHPQQVPRLETALIERVAALAPDVIVFTGDSADSPESVPVFRACLTALAKIAPTFVVRGNWDAGAVSTNDLFGGTGAAELDGTSASATVDGVTVRVIGAGYRGRLRKFGDALSALPADGPAVVLYHLPYPDLIPPALAKRVDLMCAGHVHGGQVALPFYGALLTLSKYGKRFESGLYRDADGFGFPLYVSRGIGMGGLGPRVRFAARPEIALLELVPAATSFEKSP